MTLRWVYNTQGRRKAKTFNIFSSILSDGCSDVLSLQYFNMSSLIANQVQVKTNMLLVSLKLFSVHTILYAAIQTYITYTTIIITITILICLQPSSHKPIRYSTQNIFYKLYTYSLYLHNRNFTQGWLNYNCFDLTLYMRITSVYRMFSKYKIGVFAFSTTLTACVFAFSYLSVPHACCCLQVTPVRYFFQTHIYIYIIGYYNPSVEVYWPSFSHH